MRRALLDYALPDGLIASRPTEERDGARLMLVDRGRPPGEVEHVAVRDLDRYVPPGALLVINDTRVLPARLHGWKRKTGGAVEILLLRRITAANDRERWRAMGRSSKPLRPGVEIAFDREGMLMAQVIEAGDGSPQSGLLEVVLASQAGVSVASAIEALGRVPLPHYLGRPDDAADRERYQTVFAVAPGAVAAPTAGLHLSQRLLDRLEARRIAIARVTLHVGFGTFQPVRVDDLDDHPMHEEAFVVPPEAEAAIAAARGRGAPVVAVGTTVVRALESAADPGRAGYVRAAAGETRLLIQPGYRFRVVDALMTNFHLPQSTLLALVCAFAGRERALGAYREAVAARYRFYSYGDAMLIHGQGDP